MRNEQLGDDIPYTTQDSDCDVSVNWYAEAKTANALIERATPEWGWDIVKKPYYFDVILMSIGATTAPNHCALYLPGNRILQIMDGRTSWVTKYSKYYQQYTVRIGRWNYDLEDF